jgi:hypothetical protein
MAVLSLFAFKTKAATLGTSPPPLMEMGLTSTPDGMIYLFGGNGVFVHSTYGFCYGSQSACEFFSITLM